MYMDLSFACLPHCSTCWMSPTAWRACTLLAAMQLLHKSIAAGTCRQPLESQHTGRVIWHDKLPATLGAIKLALDRTMQQTRPQGWCIRPQVPKISVSVQLGQPMAMPLLRVARDIWLTFEQSHLVPIRALPSAQAIETVHPAPCSCN